MNWEADAELFGTLERADKPFRAMLAARCVEPGKGGPRPTGKNLPVRKPSLREFADHAGVTHPSVSRYLRVWDAMAEDGIVPKREQLEPGVDVDLPDKEKWTYYYRLVFPPKPKKTRERSEEEQSSTPESVEASPLDQAAPDLSEAVSSERTGKLYEMAEIAVQDLPGVLGDQMRRLVQSLADLAMEEDPKRAYMRCFHSITEIAAALNEMKSIR